MHTACAHCHHIRPDDGHIHCPACRTPANTARHAKQQAHGRNTQRWQRLRQQVIARDQGLCQHCGQPARTVHITPALRGHHELATTNDCVLLCHRCHGLADGRRAHT